MTVLRRQEALRKKTNAGVDGIDDHSEIEVVVAPAPKGQAAAIVDGQYTPEAMTATSTLNFTFSTSAVAEHTATAAAEYTVTAAAEHTATSAAEHTAVPTLEHTPLP